MSLLGASRNPRLFQVTVSVIKICNEAVPNIRIQAFGTKATRTMAQAGKDKLNRIKDSDIDPKGRFKYILAKVYVDDPTNKDISAELSKYVVRGYADCPFHGKVTTNVSLILMMMQITVLFQSKFVYFPDRLFLLFFV